MPAALVRTWSSAGSPGSIAISAVEAVAAGIRIDAGRLEQVRSKPKPSGATWAEAANESLTWKWWLPEFWPRLRYSKRWKRNLPSLGLFRSRKTPGAVLHESVLRRIRADKKYRPRNLPPDLVQRILELADVTPGTTVTVPGGEGP